MILDHEDDTIYREGGKKKVHENNCTFLSMG